MASNHASTPPADRPDFLVETHSIDFIPDSARHGSPRGLFPMWFGANCMVVTISTGSLAVVTGFSLFWAGVALIIGLLVGGVFMAYHSAQGPQLGLPQMIQSRAQFGFFGANLPLLIVVLMYLGFFASGGVLGGEALASLLHAPVWAGIVAVSVANAVLVLLGYRVIHYYERVLTVLCVGIFIAFSIALLTSAPHAQATTGAGHPGFRIAPFMLTVALAAIYLISYAPYVADYSRYLPTRTRIAPTFWYTYAGVVVAGIWMMLLGAVLQQRYPNLGVVAQIQHVAGAWGQPFRMVVLLLIALGIVGINGLNIYGAFMSSLTIVTSYVRHWRPTLALRVWFILPIAALGTYGAFLEKDSYLNSYQDFLSFLLYFLVPWTAVNLADFYLVRHGRYDVADMFTPRGRYGRINKAGMTAYLIGCLVQIPFANVPFYEGPLAKALGGSDISWIVGILVSGACYLALVRFWGPASSADQLDPATAAQIQIATHTVPSGMTETPAAALPASADLRRSEPADRRVRVRLSTGLRVVGPPGNGPAATRAEIILGPGRPPPPWARRPVMARRKLDFHWNLRRLMAAHQMWKTTELIPLLRERGVDLSASQVYRLVTDKPERLSMKVLIALCDILDCTPADLIDPYVEPAARRTAACEPTAAVVELKPGLRPERARILDEE